MSSHLLPSTNTRSNAFLSKRANAFRFSVIRARRAELRMTNATKNAQADFLILRTDDWQINHRTRHGSAGLSHCRRAQADKRAVWYASEGSYRTGEAF